MQPFELPFYIALSALFLTWLWIGIDWLFNRLFSPSEDDEKETK